MAGRKVLNIFMMAVFLVILILPLIFADWAGGAVSQEEKRVLAKAPWKIEEEHSLRQSLESWINDNAGFRTQAMQGKIITEFHLFHQSAVPNNLVGRDDWIYFVTDDILQDYTGSNLWQTSELEQLNLRLNNLKDLVESAGGKLLMTILPDKKTIYPEYYSPYIRHETENNRTKQLAESIRNGVPAPLIVMADVLMTKKDLGMLYSPRINNGHWNSLGAYVGYEALMQAAQQLLGREITYVPLEKCIVNEAEETGVFYNAVPLTEPGYHILSERTDHQILNAAYMERFPFMTYDHVPHAYQVYFENTEGESDLPRILYVGDSYGIRLNSFLSQSASSMMYVHRSDIPSLHHILATEKFDLVIFEMAERMISLFNSDLEALYQNMNAPA